MRLTSIRPPDSSPHPPIQKNAKTESAKTAAPSPTEGPTPAATAPRFRTRSAIPLEDGGLRT